MLFYIHFYSICKNKEAFKSLQLPIFILSRTQHIGTSPGKSKHLGATGPGALPTWGKETDEFPHVLYCLRKEHGKAWLIHDRWKV